MTQRRPRASTGLAAHSISVRFGTLIVRLAAVARFVYVDREASLSDERPAVQHTRTAIGFVATASAVVAAVLIAAGAHETPSSHAGARSDVSLANAQQHYALFRRARTDADGILDDPGLKEYNPAGIEPSESRLAHSTAPGWRVWGIPASDGICVGGLPPTMSGGQYGPGTVCGDARTLTVGVAETAGAGPRGNEFYKPGETTVFGLVPDGVKEVVVDLADGGSDHLQVEDNAFHASELKQIKSIWYTGADGSAVRLGGSSWDGVDGDA
jgi:hypothetical protein